MAEPPSAQYQHFVPQFILRNFAHKYQPDDGGHKKKKKTGGKRKYEKGMFPGDMVVRNVDLHADPPVICEKPVKRILGQINMYDDFSKPTKQQREVEMLLSKLEAQASQVFRRMTKAVEEGVQALRLTRNERDLVRKFLFLLKYRGAGFHTRFHHDRPEDYDEEDRELLREYMAVHNFKTPTDVWLHNIKTIIELDMDPERKWVKELQKRMYPSDAMMFWMHVDGSYMAICTPADPDTEFILTDSSYNIFEGPNVWVQDRDTGEVGGACFKPLHEFAPVSPKLMIVLRSAVLPEALEDATPSISEQRAFFRRLVLDSSFDYQVKSMLADLPVAKARNSYTTVVDGRITLVSGGDGRHRSSHTFDFCIFPIEAHHVNTINAILLDNTARCTSVVFSSTDAFKRTLEWYLTAPCSIGKIIMGKYADMAMAVLLKLEAISRGLGSTAQTVWMRACEPQVRDYDGFRRSRLERTRMLHKFMQGERDSILEDVKLGNEPPPGNRFVELYCEKLGGSEETMFDDLDQVHRMWLLRVKIDSWSKGIVEEHIRQRNRELLIDAYLRLRPRRIWMFVKWCRFIILEYFLSQDVDDVVEPEDVIAKAHAVVETEKLARLIYIAGQGQVEQRRRPDFKLWAPFTLGPKIFGELSAFEHLVFAHPGYLRDCGIAAVQRLCLEAQREILRSRRTQRPRPPPFDEGNIIELLTRVVVKQRFSDAMRQILDKDLVNELKEVLFTTAYPTPPDSWVQEYLDEDDEMASVCSECAAGSGCVVHVEGYVDTDEEGPLTVPVEEVLECDDISDPDSMRPVASAPEEQLKDHSHPLPATETSARKREREQAKGWLQSFLGHFWSNS